MSMLKCHMLNVESQTGVQRGSSDLEHTFGEAGFLGELFEVFGIWIVVVGEEVLHAPQLVMLERRSHAFGLLTAHSLRQVHTHIAHI